MKIGSSPSFVGRSLLQNTSGKFTQANIQRSSTQKSSDTDIQKGTTSGASLSASLATSAARIAESAASEIRELRKDQLALAKKADASADPGHRSDIQTEIETIQTEIERVGSSAVGRSGDSLFSGQTYTLEDNDVVSIANLTPTTADSGVDVSTEAGAESAVETLTDVVGIATDGVIATSASTTKAETRLSELTAVESRARIAAPNAISSYEIAEKLAQSVAQDIRNQNGDAQFAELKSDLSLVNAIGLVEG